MLVAVPVVLAVAVGCSPPPSEVAEASLSVGMPDGDPGRLTDAPIAPPELSDLDRTPSQPVAMRVGEGSQLVQRSGGSSSRPAELVPTPKPDKKQPGSKEPADSKVKKPELVPTPEGEPGEKMAEKTPAKETEVFPEGFGPEDYLQWDEPRATLVVTGQQHGYIEPCGCTGLDRQKGGMARRFTFIRRLRDMGWHIVPIDGGNQVRRFGRQAEVKLQQTAKALDAMQYEAVGFGPDDLRLGVGELLAVAAADDPENALYVSANVVLIDPSLMPQVKVVERNGMRIGMTTVLDPESLEVATSEDIMIEPVVDSVRKALDKLNELRAQFRVLMFFGDEEDAADLVREVPGFQLVVVSGGYGEPTYQAQEIKDSYTKMIVTGSKGMYAGLVGIYSETSYKYARVTLTHEFEDAPEMRQLMKEYQDQLRDIGLKGLGLLPPIPHSSTRKFVGSAKCGECHTTAYSIWEGTPHYEATEHIVRPPKERGDIARHFDPECISCHVTGWNPQEYYPYESGYLALETSEHLTGSGCENCHGPGSEHSAAEAVGSNVSQEVRERLRDAMKLPLERAREACMECHDLDNSPDFHDEDAFEDVYWPEIEHYGLD